MKKKGLIALAALVSGFVLPLGAQAEVKVSDDLSIYGDGRARFEMDSRTNSSLVDQERDRFRYRLRVGFKYNANPNLELGGRLASGNPDANSPHEWLGGSSGTTTGDSGFNKDTISIDKAYVKGKYMDGWAWFGKNSMPLWGQNEYFWDDDVNPEGIAAGYTLKGIGPLSVTLQGGYFLIKEVGWSAKSKDDDFDLTTYQGVVKAGFDVAEITAAYGVVVTDGGATVRVQNSTTTASATYGLTSVQAKIKAIPDLPVTLGYDLLKSDASSNDKGSVINASASFKDFSVTYMMPDIEANAVTAFAQDDWPNYYAGFKGYEARLGYKIAKNMNVDLRRFDGELKSDSRQKEARTQINFNVSF